VVFLFPAVRWERCSKMTSKNKKFEWIEFSNEEIVEAIKNLANEGVSKSEIGMILRDQYGIPDVKELTGKTVSEILSEQGIKEEIPEDLLNLIKKSVVIREHMNSNKKDFTAKRGYQLTVSKIRRLVSYYQKKGILSKEWRYSDEKARLLVK